MKKQQLLTAFLFSLAIYDLQAQRDWKRLPMESMVSKDTVTKKGYTLIFLNQDSALDPQVKQRLVDAFFTVYPAEAAAYNPNTANKVIFFVDPKYTGVAATSDGIVRFNPQWFHKHPEDIDVVTHEVMHIVQAYGGNSGPGWLTEGIADYVRYVFGVDNAGAHWSMPDYNTKQSYTNAYRITARFLVWIEKNKHAGMVKELDSAMRSKTYTPDIWKQLTGKALDELWAEYGQNPAI